MGEHGGVRGASLATKAQPRRSNGPDGRLEIKALALAGRPDEDDDDDESGFRNFGLTGPAERSDIYTGLPTAWETQTMFGKLARRLAKVHQFKDGFSSQNSTNFNPNIPAGYTYLAQFAAHDTIRNSVLSASLSAIEANRKNLRERCLLLDALYGDGPVFSESLYQLPEKGEGYRTMLRTGAIGKRPGSAPPVPPDRCPFAHRDIPRFQQSDLSDPKPRAGRPDVLIPDQRNDDNAMVAQVTALFHHIHNAMVTALRARPDMPSFGQPGSRGVHLFENARRVTTALYRRVIKEDLLTRLLLPSMAQRYQANGFKPLADARADGIPLEFSHAAYRLGHSMVRLAYLFNDEHVGGEGVRDVIRTTSARRPHKLPPATNWIADWSNFFDVGAGKPQLSRRIGPSFNDIMLGNGDFANELVGPNGKGPLSRSDIAALSPEDRAKLPDPNCSGILLRDLVRGTVGGVQTLEAVLRAIPADIRKSTPLLANATKRAQVLRSWLSGTDVVFSETELDHLSTNPPLILWLLFEAAEDANGCSFGTLGSVIVGDVFAAGLATSEDEIEADKRTGVLLSLLFPDHIPSKMPELITFTAKTLGLENASPRFVSPVDTPTA